MLTTEVLAGDPVLDVSQPNRKAYAFKVTILQVETMTVTTAADESGPLAMHLSLYDPAFPNDEDGFHVPETTNPSFSSPIGPTGTFIFVVEVEADDGAGNFTPGRSFTIARDDEVSAPPTPTSWRSEFALIDFPASGSFELPESTSDEFYASAASTDDRLTVFRFLVPARDDAGTERVRFGIRVENGDARCRLYNAYDLATTADALEELEATIDGGATVYSFDGPLASNTWHALSIVGRNHEITDPTPRTAPGDFTVDQAVLIGD